MEKMLVNIIAGVTVMATVGFCVWFGIRTARRNKQYPTRIEYLDDGFIYHDDFGDTRIQWQDIISVEAKLETGSIYRGPTLRGKEVKYWVLDIVTDKTSLFIFTEDFEKVNFNEFITTIKQRVEWSNPQFKGIEGDINKFRSQIPPVEQELEDPEEGSL